MNEINILLGEDNEGDIILTTEAFKDMEMESRLTVVKNGEEALRYLKKQGQYEGVPSPQLVLLDINLPGIDGKQLLGLIKKDDELKDIPVVMLTCSEDDSDISDCYDNQVNWYITKPIDYDKYTKVMPEIEAFYVSFVAYNK